MSPEGQPEYPRIRRETRAPLVAPVEVEYSGEQTAPSTFTANVSLDGLFVLTPNPRPVGTRIGFELAILRDAPPIKGFGEIRWIRVRNKGPGRPAGMGILIQRMIGEEGARILRDAIAEAVKASSATGAPVAAPALDMESPEARQAFARARKPAGASKEAPGGPAARRVGPPPERKFEYGMHAQRSAELRAKRKGERSGTALDEFMSKLGFTSRIYLFILPIMLILIIIVILKFF